MTSKEFDEAVEEVVNGIMEDCEVSGKNPVVEAAHLIIKFYQSQITKLKKENAELKKENAELRKDA